MTIDLSALVCALQNNGIKEVGYKDNTLFIGYHKFYLDQNWIKSDREKWILDDVRSILCIFQYYEIIPKDSKLYSRIISDYKLMST